MMSFQHSAISNRFSPADAPYNFLKHGKIPSGSHPAGKREDIPEMLHTG
jgi:hypothetical protein